MQNLIPSIISAGGCLRLFQNFALRQPSVEKMRKLYELAASFIESKVTFKCGGWDINLYLSRENYLHIVEEYAKLDFSKDKNDGSVCWQKLENEQIRQIIDDCRNTIIYTGE
jgi:hypothetical protein